MATTYRVHLIAVREDSPFDKALGYFLDQSGEDGVDGLEFRGRGSAKMPYGIALDLADQFDEHFTNLQLAKKYEGAA